MTVNEAAALSAETVIAVVGCGTMGRGIAQVAAMAGHPVLMFDALPGAADNGRRQVQSDLERLVARGKLAADECAARMARLRVVEDVDALAPAGLVIEAIVERLEPKVELFRRIEALAGGDVILATNTSSLSVTALAARMGAPSRVVGMHFFNPAPVLPLVEVVSGGLTDPAVAATIAATARRWGKIPVRCRSTPGFIVNRVARPFYAETLRLLGERAGSPATLDAILRETGGFRMGPCELMDLIGQDINFAVTQAVYDGMFQDPRYKPSLIQKELVDAGLLGRKSGRGFYAYGPEHPKPAADDAAAGPAPARIVVEGDLGPAAPLAELARSAGIEVATRAGKGAIVLDGCRLALTDGRSATARMAESGEETVLFDLALDYAQAPRMAVAAADQASPSALSRAVGFFQALGKTVSVLDDAPGLAVMRTVAMLANEAADVLHQGIAEAADIDLAMMRGVNYPRGPLAWADGVGCARLARVVDALAGTYGEDHYRTAPLLRRKGLSGATFHSVQQG
jgi:3-hydroxybutyryl-CoA dehydrogenase